MNKQFLFVILCIIGSFSLSAQSIYYNHGQDNFLRLELNRPVYSNDFVDVSFLTFDAFLNGEFTVGGKNKIAFELPFNRFAFNSPFTNDSETQLGNIAIAFQLRDLVSTNYLEFKLRVPTASENIFNILLTDYTERISSIIPDFASIESSFNFESKNNNTAGFYYRFRPGIKLLIPTSDDTFDNSAELLLDLNGLGGYRNEKIDINAGITTTTILTEGDLNFNDSVLRQLYTTFTYNAGAFKPGLIIRVPMGDAVGDLYNVVFGVHAAYTFGSKSNWDLDEDSSN